MVDGFRGFGDMAYDVQPIGLDGWGDMAYDIQPIGLDGWGDMAYDIVPAPDPFGLEGYGNVGDREYKVLNVKTTKYQPIRTPVEKYEQTDFPIEKYVQLRPRERRYRRIVPSVRRYSPIGADTDPIRRPTAMYGSIEIEEGFIDDPAGFGVVTTEENLSRLEARRTRLIRQLGRTSRRQRGLRARIRRELSAVRRKISEIKAGESSESDAMVHSSLSPAFSFSSFKKPSATAASRLYRVRKARSYRGRSRRWASPPSGFMRGHSRSRRRRVWNTSSAARRRYYSTRPRRLDSRPPMSYRPIPRPPNPYRPIVPRTQVYSQVPLPGPTYAPLQPAVQAYAPAPLPPRRRRLRSKLAPPGP